MNSGCCICMVICAHSGPHSYCTDHSNPAEPVVDLANYSYQYLACKKVIELLEKNNQLLEEISKNVEWMVNNP